MNKLITALLTFILTACAATGPSYEVVNASLEPVADDMARVVIYRTKQNALFFARAAPIELEGTKIGACSYGSFFYNDIPAGEHKFSAELWDMAGSCEATLKAEEGETYYLQVDPGEKLLEAFILGWTVEDLGVERIPNCDGAFKLYPVTEETALKNLNGLNYAE